MMVLCYFPTNDTELLNARGEFIKPLKPKSKNYLSIICLDKAITRLFILRFYIHHEQIQDLDNSYNKVIGCLSFSTEEFKNLISIVPGKVNDFIGEKSPLEKDNPQTPKIIDL